MTIEAHGLEIRIGARLLLAPTDFTVSKGDRIGLVGRNGAGKTTLTRVITGEALPSSGTVRTTGKLGYLPPGHPCGRPGAISTGPHNERAQYLFYYFTAAQSRKRYDRSCTDGKGYAQI